MKKSKKLSMEAVVALSLVAIPTTIAHADVGVATEDITVKDNTGNVVKQFKTNEAVSISGETPTTYQVNINNTTYDVGKDKVLKTIKQTEESLSIIKEQTTLKATSNYFGDIILQLDEDDKVTRLSNEENGFIKVKTAQNIEGWVLASSLVQNIKNEPYTTTAYVDDDSVQQKSLYYGDVVQIVGFQNNQYELATNHLSINKSAISFTQPPKRLYLSPIHQTSRISSYPGNRTDPVYGGIRYHAGTDIAIAKNTPVYATSDGVVSKSHSGETENNGAGLGNYVKITHGNGIESTYGHLTSFVVGQGEQVKQGQLIGYVGTTGKSTGYHLHFEVRKNGVVMDSSEIVNGHSYFELIPAP